MNLGDLVFVRGDGFLSHEIEEITHSQYNHVAVYAGDEKVLEAQGFRKVGYQDLSCYANQYDVWALDSITDEQRESIVLFCKEKIGEDYDYALIGVEFMRNEFGIQLPWHEAKKVICSTLVNEAYQSAGIVITNIENPSPQDLIASGRFKKAG